MAAKFSFAISGINYILIYIKIGKNKYKCVYIYIYIFIVIYFIDLYYPVRNVLFWKSKGAGFFEYLVSIAEW